MRPRTAADALILTASTLADARLALRIVCSCGRVEQRPVRMWVQEGLHPSTPLGRILVRLRCLARCGATPARVMLYDFNEEAAWWARTRSPPPPWHLVLVGEEGWFTA